MKELLVSALATLAALPATAQLEVAFGQSDDDMGGGPLTLTSNFAGAYVGGGIGLTDASWNRTGTLTGTGGYNLNAWSIYGGYAVPVSDQWLVGPELAFTRETDLSYGRDNGAWLWRNNDIIDTISLGVRAGYALTDEFLPFVTAGLAEISYTFENLDNTSQAFDRDLYLEDDTVSYFGVGMDYAIRDNLMGRVELRTMEFDWQVEETSTFSINQTHTAFMVGISYRF